MDPRPAATLAAPPIVIQKTLWVRRSNVQPTLYWWSLPLSLAVLADLFPEACAAACALVTPARALATDAAFAAAPQLAPGVARVDDVAGLLRAGDAGRIGPCSMALFAPGRSARDLARIAATLASDLDRLGFSIAIVPGGEGGMRWRFACRVPGQVLEVLEAVALGRRFGGNLGQVEMALLQHLGLRPGQRTRLVLVLDDHGATLQGIERQGRRRVRYLESQHGFVGTHEDLSWREAVGARARESWRRFPVGVVMFAGLPLFIGAFWVQDAWARRRRPGARGG